MSAWTIYWIMQLDSIGFAVCAIALLCGIGLVICLTVMGANAGWGDNELMAATGKLAKRFGIGLAASLLVASFLPTTKTAAAMVVIPAIANNETIRNEAGDLYQLAKQALRDAVTDEPKKESK